MSPIRGGATVNRVWPRYERALRTCRPFLVTCRHSSALRDLPTLGLKIPESMHFDPQQVRSGLFLNILQRLDDKAFSTVGMSMPRWVFYDCAEVPGGIFGFARPAGEVPDWVRSVLSIPEDYEGPVPLSMYVAIPMLEPGAWHNYTLASLDEVAPGAAPAKLQVLTEAAGLEVFGVQQTYGATQWRSPKLGVHAHFGPLDLVTAWTPAHTAPMTVTYRFDVDPDRLRRALMVDPVVPDDDEVRWVDCDDEDEMQRLQSEIEAGRHFQLVGPPVIDGSFTRAPVREVQP